MTHLDGTACYHRRCSRAHEGDVVVAGDRQWFVASLSIEGAWRRVVARHSSLHCTCPTGHRCGPGDPGCRHMRAVVEHEHHKSARPSMPANVAALVD